MQHTKQPKEPVNEAFAMAPVLEPQSHTNVVSPPLAQPLTASSGFSESEQENSEYTPETVVFEIGGFASPENPKDSGGKGIKFVTPPNLTADQALVYAVMAMLRVSETEAKIAIEKEGIHWENYNPEGHGRDREGNVIHLLRLKEKYAVRTAHEPDSLKPKSEKGKAYYAGFQKYLAARKDAESADLSDLFNAFAETIPELAQAKQDEADGILLKNQFEQRYSQIKAEILEFAIWDNLRAKREDIAAGIEGEKTALKPTIRAMADQFASVSMDLLRQYVPARFYKKWAQLHVQAMLIEANLDAEKQRPIDPTFADGLYQLAYFFAQYAEAKLGTTSSAGQRHYAPFDAMDVQTILRIKSAETLGPNEAQLLLYSHYKLSFALFEAFGKDIAYQSESNILGRNGNKEDNLKGQQMQNAGATGKAVLDLVATKPNAQRINAKFMSEKVVSKFGKDDQTQGETIELQLYAWHDAVENEWVLEDFSKVEVFKNNRAKGEAEGPIPTELFENLNSKLRFPKGALYYRVPNEASYRILRTTEPMEWADWLRYAAMAGVAVGMALSTAGASIPATVTMIAASGAFAAADGLDMAEKSSHGMLTKHDIALHSASILACVVSGAGATMRLSMVAENALAGIEGYSAAQISQIRMVAGLQLAADVPCFALFTADAFAQLKAASEQDEMTFDRVLGFLLQMGMQGVMLVGMHQSMMEAGGAIKVPTLPEQHLATAETFRSRLMAKVGGDASKAIQFTDAELVELIEYARGLGFNTTEIDAILSVKIRKHWVGLSGMKKVAESLAAKSNNHDIVFKEGWDFMKVYKVAQERMLQGGVLEPAEYLDAGYMERHLQPFEEEVSYLIPNHKYKEFVLPDKIEIIGSPEAQYVSTKARIDEVLEAANGDIAIVERLLGIPEGDWHGKGGLWRIDLKQPESHGLRLPNGSEYSSNEFWHPGAVTSGGVAEAIVSQFPKSVSVRNHVIKEL